MTRLWPKTLFGQILLVMLTGLFLANGAGVWLVLNDRAELSYALRAEYVAQHIANTINVLSKSTASFRPQLLPVLSNPVCQVDFSEKWLTSRAQEPDVQHFEAQIRKQLQLPVRIQVISMRYQALGTEGRSLSKTEPNWSDVFNGLVLMVVVQAQLPDGVIVTFHSSRLGNVLIREPWRIVGWLSLVALVAAMLSVWAVRRLTQPLSVFANAATGLAKNLDQPALVETGPVEVVNLAQAFNSMQRAIKLYLCTRSQMLAGISHDLRLPITRLRLRLEKLSDTSQNLEIERDLAEMDALIANTLAFLRAGSQSEKEVKLNLTALLDGVVEDMEALGARITLQGQAPRSITGRPHGLRRCLDNLLDNARRYGGNVIEVGVEEEQGFVLIRITDQGSGVAEADLERVFEPYVRLETSRSRHTGGSGLGLAIARAIARAHGGDISLSNRLGGGLSAVIRLPL
jgi:signal transduction histidine kinase